MINNIFNKNSRINSTIYLLFLINIYKVIGIIKAQHDLLAKQNNVLR